MKNSRFSYLSGEAFRAILTPGSAIAALADEGFLQSFDEKERLYVKGVLWLLAGESEEAGRALALAARCGDPEVEALARMDLREAASPPWDEDPRYAAASEQSIVTLVAICKMIGASDLSSDSRTVATVVSSLNYLTVQPTNSMGERINRTPALLALLLWLLKTDVSLPQIRALASSCAGDPTVSEDLRSVALAWLDQHPADIDSGR